MLQQVTFLILSVFFFSENFDNHMGLQLVLDDHFYTRFHLMVRKVLKKPCKYYMFVIFLAVCETCTHGIIRRETG